MSSSDRAAQDAPNTEPRRACGVPGPEVEVDDEVVKSAEEAYSGLGDLREVDREFGSLTASEVLDVDAVIQEVRLVAGQRPLPGL